MDKIRVKLKRQRLFSEEFKKARVKEYESGELSVGEISTLFSVSPQCVYNWIYKYSVYNKKGLKIVELSESRTKKVKELELRINELERIIGTKQIQVDYLEKLLELAKQEYGLDIKKNSDTSHLRGFSQIEKQ
ncbi:MAG: transposase [Bacteroidales bacterium]